MSEQRIVIEQEKKKSWFQRLRGAFSRTPPMEDTWKRMHKVAGFVPMFDMDSIEQRRTELRMMLQDIQDKFEHIKPSDKDFKDKIMEYKRETTNKVFSLFFSAGSPWYRGLDDRELAKKVKAFLELWNYIGDNEAFVDDLFMCAMQLLNLSWKALDVTNVPPYIIETKTIIQPESGRVKLSDMEKVED